MLRPTRVINIYKAKQVHKTSSKLIKFHRITNSHSLSTMHDTRCMSSLHWMMMRPTAFSVVVQ